MTSRCVVAILSVLVAPTAFASECVVLLHGMVRSSSSMETMAESLEEAGYVTANIDYPSRDHTIEVLAPMAVAAGLEQCEEAGATEKNAFCDPFSGWHFIA